MNNKGPNLLPLGDTSRDGFDTADVAINHNSLMSITQVRC